MVNWNSGQNLNPGSKYCLGHFTMAFISIFLLSLHLPISSGMYYEENIGSFVPLKTRVKRDSGTEEKVETSTTHLVGGEEPLWPITEFQNEDDTGILNVTETEIPINTTMLDYIYYGVEYLYNGTDGPITKLWKNVTDMIQNEKAIGHHKHPQLGNSYRRAVNHKLRFAFPFYGHYTNNLTIATGGFCYVGEHMHSWLAATQYIAPLMANFHTTQKDSNIGWADDGKVMVVEWENVKLRHQPDLGAYTFQVQLHENGDIYFLYKNVPKKIELISDTHHPRKMGLSDAYLFEHKFPHAEQASSAFSKSKRVIYEYHRVEIHADKVTTNQVIKITAKPTCISLKTCEVCQETTLQHFKCNWCPLKDGTSFCSDMLGFHRRRQDWINGSCKDQRKLTYCTDEGIDKGGKTSKSTTPPPPSTKPQKTTKPLVSSTSTPSVKIVTDEPKTNPGMELGPESQSDAILSKKEVVAAPGISAGGILAVLFILAAVKQISFLMCLTFFVEWTIK